MVGIVRYTFHNIILNHDRLLNQLVIVNVHYPLVIEHHPYWLYQLEHYRSRLPSSLVDHVRTPFQDNLVILCYHQVLGVQGHLLLQQLEILHAVPVEVGACDVEKIVPENHVLTAGDVDGVFRVDGEGVVRVEVQEVDSFGVV